jgi:uncharacterized protein with GYD domain
MPTRVLLLKLTAEGTKSLKESRARYQESVRGLEAAGGKVLGSWAVQGPYDFLLVVDLPDEKSGFALGAAAAMRGTATTETWSAIPINEFYDLVDRL